MIRISTIYQPENKQQNIFYNKNFTRKTTEIFIKTELENQLEKVLETPLKNHKKIIKQPLENITKTLENIIKKPSKKPLKNIKKQPEIQQQHIKKTTETSQNIIKKRFNLALKLTKSSKTTKENQTREIKNKLNLLQTFIKENNQKPIQIIQEKIPKNNKKTTTNKIHTENQKITNLQINLLSFNQRIADLIKRIDSTDNTIKIEDKNISNTAEQLEITNNFIEINNETPQLINVKNMEFIDNNNENLYDRTITLQINENITNNLQYNVQNEQQELLEIKAEHSILVFENSLNDIDSINLKVGIKSLKEYNFTYSLDQIKMHFAAKKIQKAWKHYKIEKQKNIRQLFNPLIKKIYQEINNKENSALYKDKNQPDKNNLINSLMKKFKTDINFELRILNSFSDETSLRNQIICDDYKNQFKNDNKTKHLENSTSISDKLGIYEGIEGIYSENFEDEDDSSKIFKADLNFNEDISDLISNLSDERNVLVDTLSKSIEEKIEHSFSEFSNLSNNQYKKLILESKKTYSQIYQITSIKN